MFERIRTAVNGNPLIAAGGIILVVAVCVVLLGWNSSSNLKHGQLYYSTDDGATYFAAPAEAAPITIHGKTAYEARVFSCPGKGEFVGYLLRYSDHNRDAANHALHERNGGRLPPAEVKRPKDSEWVSQGTLVPSFSAASKASATTTSGKLTFHDITSVRCPDGQYAIFHVAQ